MSNRVPLRVRAAITSERWVKRATNALRTASEGLWLGALDPEHLSAANAAAYAKWDQFADSEYVRSGLKGWEEAAVDLSFPSGGSVLVPSAGAGREVIALDRRGFQVTGFDPSKDLVVAGRAILAADGCEASLIIAPPDRVPESLAGPFDAILFGWGGYVHIRTRATRVAFLSELRELVDAGAPMLLSFFLRAPGSPHYVRVARIAAAVRTLRRSSEPVEIGDSVAGTFDHHATWAEIESELADGGFEIVEAHPAPYAHLVCKAV